jgi:hypothetical protein
MALSCTALDPDARVWATDRTSGRTPRLRADATWVTSQAGPARCGLTGSRRHATCSVLTVTGWQTVTASGDVPAGADEGRAFVATQDGSIAFCRWLPAAPATGAGARSACAVLNPFTLTWSPDRVSGTLRAGAPSYPTWVAAGAGPASCWSPSADRRGGCRVLTSRGWRTASLPKRVNPGIAGTRSFLVDRAGRVSWCRLTARAAGCTALSARGTHWKASRSTRSARSMQADYRTWVSLAAGPAVCGRSGRTHQQRLTCQVLTPSGWRTSVSHTTAWGSPGYRAFVPSGSGVAYCRTVPARRHGEAVSCTPMSKLEWGATRTSARARLALPDLF